MVLSKVQSIQIGDLQDRQIPTRHIVLAIDLSDTSYAATNYYANEIAQPGDAVHLVHVSRCLQAQVSVQHGFGASYTVPELHPLNERQHIEHIQGIINSRFVPCLSGIPLIHHVLHLYFDTENTPGSAIAEIIDRVATEVGASFIVMAAHNKAYGLNEFLLGSVAEECTQHSKSPVIVVREYRGQAQAQS